MPSTKRRGFLRGSALVTAGLATGAGAGIALPQAHAADARSAATFVLVHTANASAAWWSTVVTELTLGGHRALAIDLPGHGRDAYYPAAYQGDHPEQLKQEESPAKDLTVDTYAEAVTTVVKRAAQTGPVILVAHGDAGPAAVSRAANRHPDLIAHLVYLGAYLCVDMPTIGDYAGAPEAGDALQIPLVETPQELGITRINWRSDDSKTQEAFKAALAAGFSDAQLRATLAALSPDIGAAMYGEDISVDAKTWGTIPRSYIRFTEDRTIPVKLQDRMIAEADALTPDNKTAVGSVALPHVGPLHHPDIIKTLQTLADKLTR